MGTAALLSSGVTEKIFYLIRDRQLTSPTHPLHKVRTSRIIIFTLVELLGFGATFAITQVRRIPFLPYARWLEALTVGGSDYRRDRLPHHHHLVDTDQGVVGA